MSKIVVKQTKSVITEPKHMRRILWGMGLGKIGSQRTFKDNNCVRGMINKVKHLVSYELRKE